MTSIFALSCFSRLAFGWKVESYEGIWGDNGALSSACYQKESKPFLLPTGAFRKPPFGLDFAGDIDGDGSDEVIGFDSGRLCWRLYRAEATKGDQLRWQSVVLDRKEPKEFALSMDGKQRGLVVAWANGRLELLRVEQPYAFRNQRWIVQKKGISK